MLKERQSDWQEGRKGRKEGETVKKEGMKKLRNKEGKRREGERKEVEEEGQTSGPLAVKQAWPSRKGPGFPACQPRALDLSTGPQM